MLRRLQKSPAIGCVNQRMQACNPGFDPAWWIEEPLAKQIELWGTYRLWTHAESFAVFATFLSASQVNL
jgi:hypothetical protein